jgi:hypothetical protein
VNVRCHSFENPLSPGLLSKDLNISTYNTMNLLVLFVGVKLGLPHKGKEIDGRCSQGADEHIWT